MSAKSGARPSGSVGGSTPVKANGSKSAYPHLKSSGSSHPTQDWRSRVVGRSLGDATERVVDRGQALISAAGRLIGKSGADDFTMQQVATESGLSLRVVYQLFTGKDDLLVALIEESQVVFAHLLEWHASRCTEPLDKLGAALYFATDPRQHPNRQYNVVVARYVVRTSVSAPEELGRTRRPVLEVFKRLVGEAMMAGQISSGNPETAACNVLLAYEAYQQNFTLGNSTATELPSNEQFIRFCISGLGAQLPDGWEERFRITDQEAARNRSEAVPHFTLSGANSVPARK